MAPVLFLVRKEFRQIRRDPAVLRLIFVVPLLQLMVLGYAANLDLERVPVAFLNQDNTVFQFYESPIVGTVNYGIYILPRCITIGIHVGHKSDGINFFSLRKVTRQTCNQITAVIETDILYSDLFEFSCKKI